MTPKERVIRILERKSVDRIPVDLWYTPEIFDTLCRHYKADDQMALAQAMGTDKILSLPAQYTDLAENRTLWGTTTKSIDAGHAAYEEFDQFGLQGYDRIESLDDYPWWPDPDKFDYEGMHAHAQKCSAEFATLGPWVSFFEIYCQMRGLEQAMMDLVINPEYVHQVLDRIDACQTAMLERFFARSADYIDMVFISDDMGSQENLLISLEMWRRFFKDRLTKWCDLAHAYDIKVFYHSDGAVQELIPELIAAGIDVLNPIQHICPGMNMSELKATFGHKIIFHGGVDNQSVLPFGTTRAVVNETINCLNTLGGNKQGYICCSCHNIQPGTPLNNIIAMVETVKKSSCDATASTL